MDTPEPEVHSISIFINESIRVKSNKLSIFYDILGDKH